jgi:glycosyltransferase involved in cell wall biosynthesis
MKVLHVATGFPFSFPGGITNYVRTLAKSQVALGYEVHVLARPDAAQSVEGITLHSYIPSRVVPLSLKTPNRDPAITKVQNLLKDERYDLIHFHMALDLPLQFLSDFPTLQIPYVVSLHDYFYICPRIFMVDYASEPCRTIDINKCSVCIGKLDQLELVRRIARKLKFPLPRVASSWAQERMECMKAFLQNSAMLLPVSTRTAEIYREVVPEARFSVEQIGSESYDLLPAKKTPSTKLRLTALGTLSKAKGAGILEILLKRVRRADVQFQFYGRVFEGYEARLSRLGLKCFGGYTPDDLPAIMANTDIGLVLPIWEDNGPQVAMEFVNNRIPVIGTRRGGIPDIVQGNGGFLFDPDNDREIDRAVQWIEDARFEELEAISSRITRLKSPLEHARALDRLYTDITDKTTKAMV